MMEEIKTIEDLAEALGAHEATEKAIQRRIFKATTCGCSCDIQVSTEEHPDLNVEIHPIAFRVSGYCEGCDWEHPCHKLPFPFTKEALWEAIDQADKDGIETWTRTHGCGHCQTAECKTEHVEDKGWKISWDDGESWWNTKRRHENDSNSGEPSHWDIEYRAEEWEIRVDFSEATDEYGVIAINKECSHCYGIGVPK